MTESTKQEFKLGLSDAMSVSVKVETGQQVTSSRSPWGTLRCRTCRHTFREGDEVQVDADYAGAGVVGVGHLDPALNCLAEAPPYADGKDLEEFVAGIGSVWRSTRQTTVLAQGHPLVAEPPGHGPRQACLLCAETFRVSEVVVICPCGLKPETCLAAVHRDPARGLRCWETWRPSGVLDLCPVYVEKLGRSSE